MAVAQDDGLGSPHAHLGWAYALKGEYDKALAEGERAIALDPSGADVHNYYGVILTIAGRLKEAIPMLQKAMRLNPYGPAHYYQNFGNALRDAGRFEEAVSAYKKAFQLAPDNLPTHLGLTVTYIMMGSEKEARAEAEEVLRTNPKFSLDSFAKTLQYKDQSQKDKIVKALSKAGLK